ncbi:MAG: signal peptide peptidase SppA [Planctomycetota bacterium]
MSTTSPLPPGVPPQTPPPPREAKGVAFYVAIFLGLLLVVSAGLNVLLLLFSASALLGSGGMAGGENLDEVHVAGPSGAHVRVLQIPVHGAISQAQNPLLGAKGGMVGRIEQQLKSAADDESIRGILLDIDSPGGGVTDSDEIHSAILRFKKEHPRVRVVALFGDMAASGGYYVAAAAERIVARPTTITGSIGVIMSGYNFAEAAKKLGVEGVTIKSERTPFKDILSPMRPMRDDERALLTGIVDELFDRFVDVVDQGRPDLTREQVLAVATGAIYTARQAVQNGLVDEIGDRESVLRWFERELGGDVALVELRQRPGLFDLLTNPGLGSRADGGGLDAAARELMTELSGPRFLYFWQGGR